MSNDESQPLFRTAHDAVRWALSDDRVALQQVSTYRAPGSGRGLSGFDGAAQAGMILSHIRELRSPLNHLIVAQAASVKLPCTCGRDCCSGWTTNRRWADAVEAVAVWWESEHQECSRPRLLRGCLRRFFGENVGMDTLARRAGLHRATVSEFNGHAVGPIKPLKEAAWRELEDRLGAVNLAEVPQTRAAAAA